MSFKWEGDRLKLKVEGASIKAINQTMAAAVKHAKFNHQGWKNVTGTAEGSIRILEFAKAVGKVVIGIWGSRNVDYMIWLELKRGSALRKAAQIEYKKLPRRLKRAFT